MLKSFTITLGLIWIVILAVTCAWAGGDILLVGPPMAPFIDKDIPGQGLMAELAVKALATQGVKARVRIMPWKRAFKMAANGEAQGLLMAAKNPEREKQFIYPNYYWTVRVSFYTQKGKKDTYSSLTDLCPGKVGAVNATHWNGMLEKAGCFRLEYVSYTMTNLRKLMAGRIDYMIYSYTGMRHFLTWLGPSDGKEIVEVTPPLMETPTYVAFSLAYPGSAKLASDFDAGVKALLDNGGLSRILAKYGLHKSRLSRSE